MQDPFSLDQYRARRKVFAVITPKFHLYDVTGQLVAYVEQKAFRLKEDITVFGDEQKLQPLLRIKARQIIDFSAAYDVVDLRTQEKAGALRRKGWKSLMRDEWQLLDAQDRQIGLLREESGAVAFLRRFLTNLIPQTYHISLNGQPAGAIHQHFNLFVHKFDVDLSADSGRRLDRRLALAAVVLLLAVEGRQE